MLLVIRQMKDLRDPVAWPKRLWESPNLAVEACWSRIAWPKSDAKLRKEQRRALRRGGIRMTAKG